MNSDKDWIDVLGALSPMFGSFMMACMAFAQWRTFEKERQAKLFQYYISNYRKVEKALTHIQAGEYRRALDCACRAKDEARIYLSEEINVFIEKFLAWIKTLIQKKTKGEPIEGLESEEVSEEAIQKLYRKYFPTE